MLYNKKIIKFIGISILAILIRLSLFKIPLSDYINFLSKWYETIQNSGGILALKHQIGDYTPPYILLLSLGTYITKNSLFYIKLLSCICDFILAFFVYLLVKNQFSKEKVEGKFSTSWMK